MAERCKGNDQNDDIFSHSPMEETTAMKMQLLTTSTETLTSPSDSLSSSSDIPLPVPFLPLDLVEEILCRLPVKSLLKFRCVCNSWNSLISNPKFAKKHLRLSRTRRLDMLGFPKPKFTKIQLRVPRTRRLELLGLPVISPRLSLMSYPLHSGLTTMTTNATQLEYPSKYRSDYPGEFISIVGSCDGILFFASTYNQLPCFLWNPSIRKFKELPPLNTPIELCDHRDTKYGFGYDRFTDNYKVVVVFCITNFSYGWDKTRVKVHTLGTNFWKSIQGFPSAFVPNDEGKFVSGAVNWLAHKQNSSVIVSLDLGKESYQELLQPDYGGVAEGHICLTLLGVSRDCLCILFGHDIWVMKEYGNKESWTKLFTVPYMQDPNSYWFTKLVYISEDGQVLLGFLDDKFHLVVYDSINRNFKILEIEHIVEVVSIESLISPYS